jgi:hypothetical protein
MYNFLQQWLVGRSIDEWQLVLSLCYELAGRNISALRSACFS